MKGNLHLQFNHAIDFTQEFLQMGLSEPTLVTTPVCFGWKAIHLSRPTTNNNFILGGVFFFKSFFLTLSNLFYKPSNPIQGLQSLFFFPFLHCWWVQQSNIKCFQEQCSQFHFYYHRSFQCEVHHAIAYVSRFISK